MNLEEAQQIVEGMLGVYTSHEVHNFKPEHEQALNVLLNLAAIYPEGDADFNIQRLILWRETYITLLKKTRDTGHARRFANKAVQDFDNANRKQTPE